MHRLAFAVLATGLVPASPSAAQAPQLTIREVATLEGWVSTAFTLPNGRALLYQNGWNLIALNLATNQSRVLEQRMTYGFAIAPAGDRVAYGRSSPDGTRMLVWVLPIDPQTGMATGVARPVTASDGGYPSFSPDGRMIAFGIYGESGGELALVPADGGAERVIASFPRYIGATTWSADGRSVCAMVGIGADSVYAFTRVPVAGGPGDPRVILRRPLQEIEGPLDDCDTVFFRSDNLAYGRGQLSYVTAADTRGVVQLPEGARLLNGLATTSRAMLGRMTEPPTSAQLLSLDDGTVRDLGVTGAAAMFRHSQDGRLLAMMTARDSDKAAIVIAEPGGRSPRHIPVPGLFLIGEWSPDGATLPLLLAGGGTVAMLDVATGAVRTLATGVGPFAELRWSPDGATLIAKSRPERGSSPRPVFSAIAPDGTLRRLFDAEAVLPGARAAFLADAHRVVVVPPRGAPVTHLLIGNLQTNAIRTVQLAAVAADEMVLPDQSLVSGKWFLSFVQRRSDSLISAIDVVSVADGTVRRVPLAAPVERSPLAILPSGDGLLVTRRNTADSLLYYSIVSLDGVDRTPSRPLPAGMDRYMFPTFSADGRTLPFVRSDDYSTTVFEADLTPLIPGRRQR